MSIILTLIILCAQTEVMWISIYCEPNHSETLKTLLCFIERQAVHIFN